MKYSEKIGFKMVKPEIPLALDNGQFTGISDDRAKLRHDYCVEMDNIKNKYCLDNNIELIRIPYWNFTKEYYQEIIEKIINYHNI